MARQYTKKNTEYWNGKSQKIAVSNKEDSVMTLHYSPETYGDPFYVKSSAKASTRYDFNGGGANSSRSNKKFREQRVHRFDNIDNGIVPFVSGSGGNTLSATDAIELCQKAYYNVAIFRNTIDMMSEFSNADIEIKGGTKKARDFIQAWLEKIKIWSLRGQFFREYYRSGNVFFFRFDGKLSSEQIKELKEVAGAQGIGGIPVKYTLLNPAQISIQSGSAFNNSGFLKVLSKYEIEALKNPKTKDDEDIFNALPLQTQQEIKKGIYSGEGLMIPLDAVRLHFLFYKKQDYEPFAVPFGFPVLDDINWKLEMKKQDAAISRTIENAILLITMGNKDTGEVNKEAFLGMQALFQNESVGRVLVADATTNAQFIIPNISDVIEPKKYEVVNSDIKEGLQNIFASGGGSGDKFANQQIKIKVFFKRLEEGRKAFLREFLNPEIKRVCKLANFKGPYPKANFEEIDLNDHEQLVRIYARLIEIGVLTPEEGMRAMETGILPEPDDSIESQKKFKELRDQGLYEPLIGGPKEGEGAGRPEGTSGIPQSTKKVAPAGGGKKSQAETFNAVGISHVMSAINTFTLSVQKYFRAKYAVKKLSKKQKALASEFALTLASRYEASEWEDQLSRYMENMTLLNTENMTDTAKKIDVIAATYQIPAVSASILYHSRNIGVITSEDTKNEN